MHYSSCLLLQQPKCIFDGMYYLYIQYICHIPGLDRNQHCRTTMKINCMCLNAQVEASVCHMVLLRFLGLLSIETPTELEQQAQTRKWQENRRSGRGEKGGR